MIRRSLLLSPLLLGLPAQAAPSGPLKVGGTGMALASMRLVADAFTAAGGATVDVLPSLGTAGGLRALGAGVLDLAIAARPLSAAEIAAGMAGRAYARTPIAFCTRLADPARALTMPEVVRIFTGEMTSWPDGEPIRFLRRDPSDADWQVLASLSSEMARAVALARMRPGLVTTTNDQDNADTLESLPGSFGAVTLGQIAAERRRLRPVSLDGILPSVALLEDGTWPLVRTLHAVHGPAVRPEALALLSFLRSAPGMAVLAALAHAEA
jgi:phosphate transport system substrate-binding protein